MKTKTSLLSRGLALVLAAVLAFSGAVPGLVLEAHAAEHSVSYGEVIANNYDLTEAEKDLLKSGYLSGDGKVEYVDPEENWVTVDHENKKITAEEKGNWIASNAEIIVNGESVETVALTDGEGTYAYAENAFSVRVNYVLNAEINGQEKLLAAAAYLKQGVANTDAVSGQSGNLYILEQAMPELVNFANNGVSTPLGTVSFSDACKVAVNALNAQMTANGGKLNLSKMIEVYDESYKTFYLVNSGKDMQAEVKTLVENVTLINEALTTMVKNLNLFIQNGWVSEDLANQLKTLAGVCKNLETGLADVAADEWYAANNTVVVKADAKLDALVAALGESTSVTVTNPLKVAEASVSSNVAMKNVTVVVVLKVVEDKADSAELVEYACVEEIVTLEEGASAQKIIAEAKDIVEAAIASWDAYVEGKFEVNASEVPGTLTEDITYTVTYTPVTLAVTGDVEMEVPYGYKLTLPRHPNPEQAYDYEVNGVEYAQGEVVEVLENLEIVRSAGKSYSTADLYTVVADNYGDAIAKDILKSGALKGNLAINYRKPDPADAESLLELKNDTITAENYGSDYEGLIWTPYLYGNDGNVTNEFVGNTAKWISKSVKVQYKLSLDNFGLAKAEEVINLAKTLKAEAAEQKSALDSLATLEGTLAQLDKVKLGALNGVIDVTDFSDDAEENLEIRASLKAIVSNIIANNLDGNVLKIYNIVFKYKAEGLKYYYENYEAIKGEIDSLSGYMTELMDQEEALRIMCEAAGYGEYADKISDVEGKLNEYNAKLSVPNEMIDLESEYLGKLVTALSASGEISCTANGAPYILSDLLTATDDTQVYVQVIINTPNGSATVTTATMDRFDKFTQDMADALNSKIAREVEALIGESKYYVLSAEAMVEDLVDTEIDDKVNLYYTYSYKEYTVKIEGEADQVITVKNLEVKLPKHPVSGWVYRYTVDGVSEITTSTYTFTLEQLDRLFTTGSYTITRVEANEAEEKLEETFNEWLIVDENGKAEGLYAKVNGDQNGIMDFVMTIVNSGYSYIGLDGEPLLYLNEENVLEIKLNTLYNALMNDEEFSSQSLINLGKKGKGEFVHASMQLGNAADDIQFEDLDFTLYLNSVPGVMGTVANGLETIKPYLTFEANNGVMDINVNLPEKVYEVYLAVLLATGEIEKDNMDAINSEIALQFLWDYVEIITATDADMVSYTNTLAKLGINKDLTGAEDYYQLVKRALSNEGVKINEVEDEDFEMSVTAKGQKAINALISLAGVDVSSYATYLGMIYEYKNADAEISAEARVNLVNTEYGFEAALIDIRHSVSSTTDYLKKFDFTKDLEDRAAEIAGEAVIMLLSDVNGNLTLNDATIIDLNGYTINGNIVANGTTLIFDSSLDTYNCGGVNGTVSGKATIIGGNYTSDVTAFIPNGYEVENGTVRNVFYTVNENNDDVVFAIDADVLDKDVTGYMEAAIVTAIDMVADLVLNYITTASLSIDNYSVYNITVEDIIGLYDSTNRVDALVDTVIDFVSLDDINGLINDILDKMVDYAAIEAAIDNNEAFISFEVTTAPWSVALDHVVDGDYVTVGIVPNEDLAKTFSAGIRFDGSQGKKDYAADFAGGLSDIIDVIDADVEILAPSFKNNKLTLGGKGSLTLIIDVTKDNNTANDTSYTNEEYLNVLAVAVAHGIKNTNAAKSAKLVAAIGNNAKMKEAIDSITVKDLFTALKNLSVSGNFDKMAADLGITADLGDAARIEAIYHLLANVTGEALELLNITGYNKNLGLLYNDVTGYYELTGSRAASESVSKGGYTVSVGAEIEEVVIKVRLFDSIAHLCTPGAEVIENEVAADCDTDGSYDKVVYCVECGNELSRETVIVPALGHTAGAEVIENEVAADCDTDGSYDKVVYCEVCDEELSRETVVVPALGHTAGEAVKENVVPATCTEDGSYDEVVYCSVCGEELSRETVVIKANGEHVYATEIERVEPTCTEDGYVIKACGCGETETTVLPALGHTAGAEVIENEVVADCDTDGSYDKVVYCSVCDEELSRETVIVPALGHTAGAEVVENEVAADCDTDGSYDKVVYCEVCDEELSRETVVVPALGHTAGAEVVENEVAADCDTDGSYDKVVYCEVCGEELSRETVVVPALGHTAGAEVIENEVAADCDTDGSYDKVVYCEVCGEELSRETVVVPALGHDFKYEIVEMPTCTEKGVRKITCQNGCDYEEYEDIDALGHDWGAWVVVKPATYTSMGLAQRCCEREGCHVCETKVLPMLARPSQPEDDREDEENPSTGAPVFATSALTAIAVIAGAAITVKSKKR